MPNLKSYIGIDPGASGGMAVIIGDSAEVFSLANHSYPQILDRLREWDDGGTTRVMIERVGGFMGQEAGEKQGHNRASAHTMFSFGYGAGMLEGFVISLGYPYEKVTPQGWQKGVGLKRAKSESKGQWKNRLKAIAQKLYPDVKVTLAVSDAILIAHYNKLTHEG